MIKPIQAYWGLHRQVMVVSSLIFFSLFSAAMFMMRVIRTQNLSYGFLIWNLFLAWIPMISALVAYNLHKRRTRISWLLVIGCTLGWLLFMPNAPYIVTDLLHLQPRGDVPFWYDVMMIASFAWTGVFLGLVSLFLMQEIVRKTAGRIVSWCFAIGVLGLSSFGIYLGRFLRWNSWDVLFNPRQLLTDILLTVRHPIAHFETYVFSIVFGVFIVSIYLMLTALINFRQETQIDEI